MESSRLIRDGVDRDRMLDMDRRLVSVRRDSLFVLGLALVASGPWLGWWTLAPLLVAAVLFRFADRIIAGMDRPEYALFAAWLSSEMMIAVSLALTGGPTAPMMCWLAIPMVTLVARFSDRGIALGLAASFPNPRRDEKSLGHRPPDRHRTAGRQFDRRRRGRALAELPDAGSRGVRVWRFASPSSCRLGSSRASGQSQLCP